MSPGAGGEPALPRGGWRWSIRSERRPTARFRSPTPWRAPPSRSCPRPPPSAWSTRSAIARRLALALDNAGLFSDLESVERRMDAVMSKIPEAVAIHDAQGDLVYANEVAATWMRFETPAELVAATPAGFRSRYELFDEAG